MSKPRIKASKRIELFMAGYRIDLVIDIVLAQPRSLPDRHADVHYHTEDAKEADCSPQSFVRSKGTMALAWLGSRALRVRSPAGEPNRHGCQIFARQPARRIHADCERSRRRRGGGSPRSQHDFARQLSRPRRRLHALPYLRARQGLCRRTANEHAIRRDVLA